MSSSPKHQFLACLAFLCVLLTALFFPVVIGQKSLLQSSLDAPSILLSGANGSQTVEHKLPRTNDPGSPAWFAEPSYQLLHNEFLQDHVLPLWNPYNGFGVPLLANMQSQPFFPLTALAWLNPSPYTVSMYLIARLLVSGILMFAFVRLFLLPLPSVLAAVAFMLSGYFILYLNMPELSVAIVMPGLFMAVEMLMREPKFRNVALTSLFTALVLYGGMPETSLLVLLLAGEYAVMRMWSIAVVERDRPDSYRLALRIRNYIVASILGCALAAPQVFPFLEYMAQSFTTHQPNQVGGAPGAIYHPGFFTHFLTYLSPLCYGPLGRPLLPEDASFFGFSGYWGGSMFFLALLGVASAVVALKARREQKQEAALGLIALFFAAVSFVFVGKRFGLPLVQWIGHVPLLQLIFYWKYGELPIGFAMAVMAAFGMNVIITKKLTKSALVVATSIFILALGTSAWAGAHLAVAYGDRTFHILKGAAMSALAIFGASAVACMAGLRDKISSTALGITILSIVCLDLAFCFFVPTYYRYNGLPSAEFNPYQGAPYIKYLQSQCTNYERVFAMDGVLYPNWSSAFKLFDVRDLDAIYPDRYFKFVRNFAFENPDMPANFGDTNLTTRFTGTEPSTDLLNSIESGWLWKRFFELSSVRYAAGAQAFLSGLTHEHIEDILHSTDREADQARISANVRHDGSVFRFMQQKSGSELALRVDREHPWLGFALGFDPKMYDARAQGGVSIKLFVVARGQAPQLLFEQTFDPLHNPGQRDFFYRVVDMRAFVNHEIVLDLDVDAKGSSNDKNGWARLLNVRFMSSPRQWVQTHSIVRGYSEEADACKLPDALPRAALFYSFVVVDDGDTALARLRDNKFDVWERCVVERSEGLPGNANEELRGLRAEGQQIEAYKPDFVRINVDAKHDGVLMLNDTMYPGWIVQVDGKQASALKTDYLFRGVFLPAGKHTVEWRYAPLSFMLGAAFALGACLVLWGWYLVSIRKS